MFRKDCLGDLCHLPGVHLLAAFLGGCLIGDRGLFYGFLLDTRKKLLIVEKVISPIRCKCSISCGLKMTYMV